MSLPRIALTTGDPAGIGPEIVEKALVDPRVLEVCEPVRYGPSLGDATRRFPPGLLSAAAGQAAYEAIVDAVRDARAGTVDAMPPPRSTRRRSRWPACPGLATPTCSLTCARRRESR